MMIIVMIAIIILILLLMVILTMIKTKFKPYWHHAEGDVLAACVVRAPHLGGKYVDGNFIETRFQKYHLVNLVRLGHHYTVPLNNHCVGVHAALKIGSHEAFSSFSSFFTHRRLSVAVLSAHCEVKPGKSRSGFQVFIINIMIMIKILIDIMIMIKIIIIMSIIDHLNVSLLMTSTLHVSLLQIRMMRI